MCLAEYAVLRGTNPAKAKLRYAKVCKATPTYGVKFVVAKFKVQAKGKFLEKLVGYSKDDIVLLDLKTLENVEKHPLLNVIRWQADGKSLRVDFKDYPINSVSTETISLSA